MSSKSPRITAFLQAHQGQRWDAHYLGFFDCFNRQLYFEAHEVLEELWLQDRFGPGGAFYKGLIQLAGAFVHVQKSRPGPAAALLRLAQANLVRYGPVHEGLELPPVLALIEAWLTVLKNGGVEPGELHHQPPPQLALPNG
jgi:predicted metal-dependent hydrolase